MVRANLSYRNLNARIGCLNVPMDPEIARTFKASQRLLGENKSTSKIQTWGSSKTTVTDFWPFLTLF